MKLFIVSAIVLSGSLSFGAAAAPESIVNCSVYAKLNGQDHRPVSVKLRSYTINSDEEVSILGDETCAIVGKFRVVLDPSNRGISIAIADVSNARGQVDGTACRAQNNPPINIGLPPYTPIATSLYQRLPKDVRSRAISTHGFTGLQYVTGHDGQSQLQFYCN
ncbi:MAG: hypothetical protein NDI61_09490 [Bdellovibrionaceae bacterium]|nr:hypothetical protein [Pseudobdellovibrionaceae bacterium]